MENIRRKIEFMVGGIVTSEILIGGFVTYCFYQPDGSTMDGKTAAAIFLTCMTPLMIGSIPMGILAIKESYRDIKENGLFRYPDNF